MRECISRGDRPRVGHIVEQLCSFLTQPQKNANARNGGLIGLAGLGIALGQEIAVYLDQIIHPVLACFSDADPKTRYFACESFYNIAKVCKGEILVYFNDVFVVLARLAADAEVSVKNGAELLDRLFKDIVCESAPHYVSVYQDVARVRARQDQEAGHSAQRSVPEEPGHVRHMSELHAQNDAHNTQMNKAFSLARFVPLLAERMQVISPLTRNYLVSWIAVLDSVPDLQLVSYLSVFLRHLFAYLSDPNTDVRVATAEVLADLLREIRAAAQHQRGSQAKVPDVAEPVPSPALEAPSEEQTTGDEADELVWVPAQDVRIDYAALFEILLEQVLSSDTEIQATTFEWITEFVHVAPGTVVPFTPRLVSAVLPCLAHPSPAIQTAVITTNKQLFDAVEALPPPDSDDVDENAPQLDYSATSNALKEHLLDHHDQTRLCTLEWLIMLHHKCPSKLFSMDDGSTSVLLRVLSDPSEEVILCDLRLLTQICSRTDERHFRMFISDLLELLSTDRKLLEAWGSLIIRQLCSSLETEHVFCTLASILETYEDFDFASIMVQNLNMILIASPELRPLRRQLRSLESRESQRLFVKLYRCWCHNPISAFCLCLLTQAYEHAYDVLRIFAELEITLTMLLQIDKLVQLIESPIFTALRLQLLEPEQNPHLLKCLYGVLMLLPQSSAFATLRNRLHAVNGLGYLSMPARSGMAAAAAAVTAPLQRTPRASTSDVPWPELLMHFRTLQSRHESVRDAQAERAPRDLQSSAHHRDATRESALPSRDEARRRRPESTPFHGSSSLRSATAPLGTHSPRTEELRR